MTASASLLRLTDVLELLICEMLYCIIMSPTGRFCLCVAASRIAQTVGKFQE